MKLGDRKCATGIVMPQEVFPRCHIMCGLLWWFQSEAFDVASVIEVEFEFCLNSIPKSGLKEIDCFVSVGDSVCDMI